MANLYKHGIYVDEVATKLPEPDQVTSGIQVVIGTAPLHLADNPAEANKPVLCESFEDAEDQLGYCTDFANYTLCASMYATFAIAHAAPIVFINVLDPTKHKKSVKSASLEVSSRRATIDSQNVITSTLTVKSGDTTLTEGTDYTVTVNDGKPTIVLLSAGKGATATTLTAAYDEVDPSKVTTADILGETTTSSRTGIEAIRDVYPRCQVIPATILAPGWSHNPEVAKALMDKTKEINGVFHSYALVDLDTTKATDYTKVEEEKQRLGAYGDNAEDVSALWPMVRVTGISQPLYYSAVYGAGMEALDAENGDVPCRTPSNVDMGIIGTCLADGTEVNLDFVEANEVNNVGVVTAVRAQGWKTWGDETCAWPDNTDVKDHFIGPRRMFSWQANSFIVNYMKRIDNNISYRMIESLVTDENIRCNALAAADKWAGGRIESREKENPLTDIIGGTVKFHQYIAPFSPAKVIEDTLEYSADILAVNLAGAGAIGQEASE